MAGTETYLQAIQAAISRLAGQSVTVKGWCVTLSTALLGFGATTAVAWVSALAIYVVLIFAVLDAYYLVLERRFRDLYADALAARSDEPSWVMTPRRTTAAEIIGALGSPAITLLYGSSLLIALTVTIAAARR